MDLGQIQSISLIDDISCAMDNHYQTDLILIDFIQQDFWYSVSQMSSG